MGLENSRSEEIPNSSGARGSGTPNNPDLQKSSSNLAETAQGQNERIEQILCVPLVIKCVDMDKYSQ